MMEQSTDKKKITLVAPFYNEEQGVSVFFERVATVFARLEAQYRFEVIAVNDGSRDGTYDRLLQARERYPFIKIVDFSRNFGKEAALTAGLDYATGDVVVPIDSDLQHPPEIIVDMLARWREGYDVVLARRRTRQTDGRLYRFLATRFYRFSRRITDVEIPADVGDFRLMDRKVVDAVRNLREECRFMKGVFAWVGFRTTAVIYDVEPRGSGRSSFNTWKLWNFALQGITSFSTVPLRVWSYAGLAISLGAFVYAAYLVIKTLLLGADVPGYSSLMVAILFFSGVQLIGIGVLGEYVGRIFSEVKQRPLYIVRDFIE